MRTRVEKGLKGLVIITGFGPVAKDLTDIAVGPFFALIAVVGGVWRGVGHLHLCGTVLGVMEVKAVADVTEQPGRSLLLHGFLVMAAEKRKSALCVTKKVVLPHSCFFKSEKVCYEWDLPVIVIQLT